MALKLVTRRKLEDVIETLTKGERHGQDVTGHFVEPARSAQTAHFPEDLHPSLLSALNARGIHTPYVHQARAIDAIRAGRHVTLTTPTASGKTLCYNVPVLERLLENRQARALYLFPTKALAQDQYAGLHRLIEASGVDIGTHVFDGDTPPDARRAVRDHGRVVLTNPDMLHSGILPHHTRWLKLFEHLEYVVIDELHTYRGVFGSHFAHVLRRLRRICQFHGSDPVFVCCSATVANPLELTRTLTGLKDFELITESGAPTGEHHLVCYNPPVVNAQLGIRAGVIRSAHRIAEMLLEADVSTIVFAGSRLHVEILLKYIRESAVRMRRAPDIIQGYRGGYLPLKRRRIEAGLRAGSIKIVVATNALELGLDIGSLEACVVAGYPGSIASLRQQSGRAGRRAGRSLTVYIARSAPVDQYLVTHPNTIVDAPVEHARANPENLFVLVDHAKCAAFELPFNDGETYADLSGEDTDEVLTYLSSHGVVNASGGRYHWTERAFPAHRVNLRGIHEENFVVIDLVNERVLAEVDFYAAHTTLHEHAIYHVDAFQYQVERLDYDDHKAFVRKVEPDYYTTALTHTRVDVLDEEEVSSPPPSRIVASTGEVLVSRKVVGFKKVRFRTNENVGYGDVNLPAIEMHTTACWLTVPQPILAAIGDHSLEALSGVIHALHVASTLLLMCAERDIGRAIGDRSTGLFLPPPGGGESTTTETFTPTLFLYDSVPGGVGLAEEIRRQLPELLDRSKSLIAKCRCDATGCPACLGAMPAYDGHARNATLKLLEAISAGLPE
ncbi:MAG: DEAD/DEAH box helicase [Myxococcota bacterium]